MCQRLAFAFWTERENNQKLLFLGWVVLGSFDVRAKKITKGPFAGKNF